MHYALNIEEEQSLVTSSTCLVSKLFWQHVLAIKLKKFAFGIYAYVLTQCVILQISASPHGDCLVLTAGWLVWTC